MQLWFLIGGLTGALLEDLWTALFTLLLAMFLFELLLPRILLLFPALTAIAPWIPGLHYADVGLALGVFLTQVYKQIPGYRGFSAGVRRGPVILIIAIVCVAFVPLPNNPKVGLSPITSHFILPPQDFRGDFLFGGDFQRRKGWISEDFASDTSLNTNLWTSGSPLMNSMAKNMNSEPVSPQITHTASGIVLTGANGNYQFTGIQSKVSFSTPLALEVAVNGTKANGFCFELYLITADLNQYLRVAGNLNDQNGTYYGVWLTSTMRFAAVGLARAEMLYSTPQTEKWYTIRFEVDSKGVGGISISNRDGVVVASRRGVQVGCGPFYVVLGQREGAPYTSGPNEAVWSWFRLTSDRFF